MAASPSFPSNHSPDQETEVAKCLRFPHQAALKHVPPRIIEQLGHPNVQGVVLSVLPYPYYPTVVYTMLPLVLVQLSMVLSVVLSVVLPALPLPPCPYYPTVVLAAVLVLLFVMMLFVLVLPSVVVSVMLLLVPDPPLTKCAGTTFPP